MTCVMFVLPSFTLYCSRDKFNTLRIENVFFRPVILNSSSCILEVCGPENSFLICKNPIQCIYIYITLKVYKVERFN